MIQNMQKDFRNNILSLYDFYVAAKCRNIKHAAMLNNISYSALNRSIRNLENKYKVHLIIPNNKGIELTNEGLELYNNLVKKFDKI